jgi:glucose/arabinose dehydrogenase
MPAFRFATRVLLAAAVLVPFAAHAALPLDTIRLPPGFTIELVTDHVPQAREMALGAFENGRGRLFVGSMAAGNVYAVTLDQGRATDVKTIAHGLQLPVGVAYRDGSLYVSAVSRVVRLDRVDGDLDRIAPPTVVTDRFPTETHHGWKFIAFGPDGDLYVPVGAPCNICERDESRYYNLQKIRVDGSAQTVVAKGIRNTVGFDWNPVDGSLWFTDNGRDLLGDDVPSDELNHVPAKTAAAPHFGFPYCHQGDVPDPEFGREKPCSQFTPPAALLGAHVASLGMRFYQPAAGAAEAFPAAYRKDAFIAEHGSWNRSKKSGYRVASVTIDGDKAGMPQVFAEGWLRADETVWGRPADVLPLPDGSLLVSDDLAGAIYRIRYGAH